MYLEFLILLLTAEPVGVGLYGVAGQLLGHIGQARPLQAGQEPVLYCTLTFKVIQP